MPDEHATPITAVFVGTVVLHEDDPVALDVVSDYDLHLSDSRRSPIRGLVGRKVRVTVEVLDD